MKIMRQETICYGVEIPEKLDEFRDWTFSSGGRIGEDFRVFARLFKKFIKSNLSEDTTLVSYSVGHYYVSGFIEKKGRLVYFSISDVRYFHGEWCKDILVRTAKYIKDYSGGINYHTDIECFHAAVDKMLAIE